ncbi:hypothetical protein KIF59_21120 [Enterobacter cloacae subsp. cloacae]|nr:hypothetical protein [Enterobacter cloacae subsp. cloacae]
MCVTLVLKPDVPCSAAVLRACNAIGELLAVTHTSPLVVVVNRRTAPFMPSRSGK